MVVSRYHGAVTDALCQGAVKAFTDAGGSRDDLVIVPAPGSFELTAVCRALAVDAGVDAVVALGCIIAGETAHDEVLAHAVAHGLTAIAADTGVPVSFGVLTCRTPEQARERAGGRKGNKGAEAMGAAIEAACAIRGVRRAEGAASHGRHA